MRPAGDLANTVRTVLAAATAELAAAGVASARVEAEWLLAHVLGCGRGALLAGPPIDAEQRDRFAGLVRRRATGIPLQHLTGRAAFRHLDLAVGPGVFVPRPETELFVELAAPWLVPGATVVDLCAGSGAIALAVANECPVGRVLAVERSPAALEWLRRNAADRQAAGDRPVEVVAADVAAPDLLAEVAGTVSAVLTNPPYVAETLRESLPPEVAHDPDDALYAGPDGLALMPALIALAGRLLRPGGLLAIEHAEDQTAPVHRLLAGAWEQVAGHPDLTGRPRFSTAVRG
ncbi:MAG: peptide chain release factor N(5)-glutamine methyltransferase [Actinobacteria bacterium]|nr:peptide chain release factor N(5)-glutamine methyltransferase [Actinomycetota bacterium]